MKRGKRDPVAGLNRSLANARRMHRLGIQYRREVPLEERSYRRWLEFLAGKVRWVVSDEEADAHSRHFDAAVKIHAPD